MAAADDLVPGSPEWEAAILDTSGEPVADSLGLAALVDAELHRALGQTTGTPAGRLSPEQADAFISSVIGPSALMANSVTGRADNFFDRVKAIESSGREAREIERLRAVNTKQAQAVVAMRDERAAMAQYVSELEAKVATLEAQIVVLKGEPTHSRRVTIRRGKGHG